MNVSSEFDVFFSYNSADHETVERIARALTERGLKVFLDRWELIPGRSWPDALEGHLNRCHSAAVILGPSGMGTWQHREHYLALDRQARDGTFGVIPVLLPGADPALGFLSLNTWIDLRQSIDDPPSMDRLASAVRGQPPAALLEQSRRTTAEICPYRGLEVFREEDATFFYGRETFTHLLLERVEGRDFVAVVGASGSGKSSVVRAGLVPALRRCPNGTVWDVLTMVPGDDPLAALARVLDPPPAAGLIAARAHVNAAAATLRKGEVTLKQLVADHLAKQPGTDRLLLIIDQFEELATLAKDGADQACFVDLLLEATGAGGALSVLLTLRSDFYTQLVCRRDLNDRLQDGVVHIGPLSRKAPENTLSELETIIRRPAEAVDLGFEDGLVSRIVGEVGTEPGNLPLLEYLLTELWRRRARGLLTHKAYEDLGGVKGAMARRADEAYERLDPEQQRAARRLFLSLVRPGEGQEDTRIPASFPEDPLEAEVARRFCGAHVRLLVADEDALRGRVVEVSHEALIRNWSMLRRWVDDNRETLRARERVRQRMLRWRHEGRPTDLLLPSGLELEEGRRLLQIDTDVSMDEVHGYIAESILEEESRMAAHQARLETERQRELTVQRQKRRLVASGLVVCLVLLALAAWQWRQVVREKKRAQDLIGFIDVEVVSFTNAPLQLRERVAEFVSDRLDAFYPLPTLRSQRIHHHMRKAMVHLAAAGRYEEDGNFSQTAREYYSRREHRSAGTEFKEAIRLGDLLAAEDPGDHRVTRDQIVSHIRLSELSAQLDDQDAAKEHLRTAQEMLEALVRDGPFSRLQWMDWMGLPNLEAAAGDLSLNRGDKEAAHKLYEKALALQNELVARRPWDIEREDELQQIKKHIEETSE